ncbi:MAG: NADH-quinone oxidoreductase subunit A [Hydrogenophilus sp.]|nr:NADH-quinone oxidoreductase subunit A [Hydrogenophilus sp.]
MAEYLPVVVFLVIALAIGVAPMVFGWVLGPRRPDPEKRSPYECGFEPFEDARLPFDVRYYLIAILFILFDVEITLLFPWGVAFRDLIANGEGWFALGSVALFLAVLTLGYVVEWKNGALDWE